MPLVREGRNAIAQRIVADATGINRKYDSTGAVLWVSSSTAAHDPTSTWFGGTPTPSTMNAGYPSIATNIIQFQGTYSTAQANHQWEQWGITNATASSTGSLLNIAPAQALGTKTSAQSWQLTACCTVTT